MKLTKLRVELRIQQQQQKKNEYYNMKPMFIN